MILVLIFHVVLYFCYFPMGSWWLSASVVTGHMLIVIFSMPMAFSFTYWDELGMYWYRVIAPTHTNTHWVWGHVLVLVGNNTRHALAEFLFELLEAQRLTAYFSCNLYLDTPILERLETSSNNSSTGKVSGDAFSFFFFLYSQTLQGKWGCSVDIIHSIIPLAISKSLRYIQYLTIEML